MPSNSQAVSDLQVLLAHMQPVLNAGVYYFASLDKSTPITLDETIAMIQEQEGLSVVVSEKTLQKYQLNANFKATWITLNIHSDLAAIGLTAAFATALSNAGISCNVVAGYYHDHIFVPEDQAKHAMQTLIQLQKNAQQG